MKYLGVDFGGKRIGIALSDEEKAFAFPHSVIENNSQTLSVLEDIVAKENIEKIIIGDSKNLNMKNNPIMDEVERFVKGWKIKSSVPVDFFSEIWTSQEAARVAPKDVMHDARAAALILQGYLDAKR